ncbi:Cadherin EGF LAG seven-pass G-type receptor 2 [Gossypium australe]|uniref:Cadherin EGF LAG seven-pass G-type receptor 2 n=1 Tax=Gossypium australe TaxID=47621 RepID=A0A5B6WHV5_9ROSI|nr:Cadherin EGF LAG seven-pass G-type receptor 2 [Gossypium australe]
MNCSELKSKQLGSPINPQHALILNVRRIQARKSFINDALLRAVFGTGNKIPRHVVALDEKYLRYCLKLIHVNAAKAAQCSISVNLSSTKTSILSNGQNPAKIPDENTGDLGRFIFKCPLEVRTDSLYLDSAEPWVVGSIMGSRSMVNILKSTLLEKSGAFNVNPSLNDVKRLCTWNGGIPYFVFSLDNKREVYVANLAKDGAARNKGLDYMYLLHSSKSCHKEHGISDHEFVGKMTVSTSFSICPQDSKIMETEFVLFSGNKTSIREMQTSSNNHRKNKGLSEKVVEAFKSSHLSKQSTFSRFCQSSSIMEDSSWDPYRDTVNNSDSLDGMNLFEEQLPRNLELTAIVVRDHFPENPRPEVGGWGLKFLSKPVAMQNIDPLEAPVHSFCSRNNGVCSTSMDVVIPAGIHGGPRTRNGGPSSLIERWRSGGHCECGGWDLGCPLTVLKSGPSKGGSPATDMPEYCKLFDFCTQGPEYGSPTLRMTNVHDGLYLIHFQSAFSALQSLAIAVAYIHTQSPTFRPKNVQQSR